VRDRIRVKYYGFRTETQYVQWIRRFILFHGKRHPSNLGVPEIEAFLTYLAVEGKNRRKGRTADQVGPEPVGLNGL